MKPGLFFLASIQVANTGCNQQTFKKRAKSLVSSEKKRNFAKLQITAMVVVTSRDFRANQSRYIGIAHRGEDVILKSRAGSVRLIPVDTSDVSEQKENKVYVENGEVKVEFVTDTMSIEEAKELTLKAVELEYMLP